MIESYCTDVQDLVGSCKAVLGSDVTAFFGDTDPDVALGEMLGSLRADLSIHVEYPYVDRVYRDSYYTYFSSKLTEYPRNCVRVCLFNTGVNQSMFFSEEGREWLEKNFLGFFVIRPTPGANIGRSCISPNAFRNNHFRTCVTTVESNVKGVRLVAAGFPYASQDRETMTCAETSLWALVEYFSHKYHHYTPVLPSKIHRELASTMVERQMPSRGLSIPNLSYGLKGLGFATRIYASASFDHSVLMDMVDIYLESGVPVLTGMSNGVIGHAFLTVGKSTDADYSTGTRIGGARGHGIFDYPNSRSLIVIDDNHPPYACMDREDNDSHYIAINADDWKGCRINSLVVPLYPKVYLEAYEARQYMVQQLQGSKLFDGLDRNVALRVFLASARTYKKYMLENADLDMKMKVALTGIETPKFIWVAEVYDCNGDGGVDVNDINPKGLMIVDATDPHASPSSLILGAWDNTLMLKFNQSIARINISLRPFKPFSNLTNYPN